MPFVLCYLVFFGFFFVICYYKVFSPSMPKEKFFFGLISKMPHQCSPVLLESSVLAIKKGYLQFFMYHLFEVDKFVRFVRWKYSNEVVIEIFIINSFYCVFYLKVWYSLILHFDSCKVYFMLFLLRSLLSQIRLLFYFIVWYFVHSSYINFGVCFIPSSIVFCPRANLKSWEPILRCDFSKLQTIQCPLCFFSARTYCSSSHNYV